MTGQHLSHRCEPGLSEMKSIHNLFTLPTLSQYWTYVYITVQISKMYTCNHVSRKNGKFPSHIYVSLYNSCNICIAAVHCVNCVPVWSVDDNDFFYYSDRHMPKKIKPWFFFLLAIAFSVSDIVNFGTVLCFGNESINTIA